MTQNTVYSWHNVITKTVPHRKLNPFASKSAENIILNNVSGEARCGELVALLGPSGAGKTTLLHLLSGRSSHNLTSTGTLNYNGKNVKFSTVRKLAAYVQQFEQFVPLFTVREHLLFYAHLKLGDEFTQNAKIGRVDALIEMLMLSGCSSTLTGIPGVSTTLSGGEYRRLILATEMIHDTPLVLCDEPTTGLDRNMADSVVSALKHLASTGKLVICSIHQPSSAIFAKFDRVILMNSGQQIFSGTIQDGLQYFERQGFKLEDNTNPADFFIKIIRNADENGLEIAYSGLTVDQDNIINSSLVHHTPKSYEQSKRFCSTFLNQLKILSQREIKIRVRESKTMGRPMAMLAKLAFQLQLVYKEQRKNLYSSFAYLSALHLVSISNYVILTIPYILFVYFLTELPHMVSTFFWTWLVLILQVSTSVTFGIAYALIVNNYKFIGSNIPIMYMILFGASGLFLNQNSLPAYLTWFKEVCFTSRIVEALSIILLPAILSPNCTLSTAKLNCFNEDEILHSYGLRKDNLSNSLWILPIIALIFFIVSNILMYFISKFRKE